MNLGGIYLQIITKMEPVIPVMLFCLGVTIIIVGVLFIAARTVWVDEARFRLLGIFYGLNGYDCYRLSLSWVRLLMTVFFVVAFRSLDLDSNLAHILRSPQFSAYLLVGILYVVDFKRPKMIVKNLLWFLAVSCGLFATSIICGYMQSLAGVSIGVTLIYISMSIFMCLFALYLFLMEIETISKDRKIDSEKEYEESVRRKEE